jgi:lipid-A-disaccharide synthase
MIEAARIMVSRRPELRFVSAMANAKVRTLFETAMKQSGIPQITLIDGQPLDVMAAADVVLVASGTAALETMLVNRPMVVCYRLSQATYALARMARLIKTRYVSLPNILASERLVPELIQREANGPRLAEEVMDWLDDSRRRAALKMRFAEMHLELRCNAGEKAAEAISTFIREPS